METINGTTFVANTSSSTNTCDSSLVDSVTVKVIKTAAYSVLLLFSLVGNSLVPAIVYRNPLLHTSINYFIASMSISDLLIPIFAYPEQISYFHAGFYVWKIDGWFGSLLCKLKDFAKDTSVIVTVLTLMIVSYERFLAVVYPLRRQHLRRRKSCFIAISLTWVFAMLYSSQHFYNWRLKTVNGTTYCILFSGTLIESWIYNVCFLIIPFFVLTCFYSSIIVSLKRKKTPGLSENEQRKRKSKEYRRITYMLMANVVLFLYHFPGLIYSLLSFFITCGTIYRAQPFCLFWIIFVSLTKRLTPAFTAYLTQGTDKGLRKSCVVSKHARFAQSQEKKHQDKLRWLRFVQMETQKS